MLTKNNKALIAIAADKELAIRPEMANRHGLITGATGTGKTVTLQTMAETFSAMGVPVFMADVKGDLTGIALPGKQVGKPWARVQELKLEPKGFVSQGYPVCLWDAHGKSGHPLRATVSDVGPLLLSRLLNLNDVQAGVLQIIFRITDDNGWLLLDLKDLRSMTQYVSDERDNFKAIYGQVAPASIGAIMRQLLRLEEEGGDQFFGEPALEIMDLLRTQAGKGVINILDATSLSNAPGLYSCCLLYLLSELFERLPERGDQEKPVLIFFFDEAHLLFDGISQALMQKIEQVVRLIRSRGVGIYFVSQNPSDIPDVVLGQLGNRVQHSLRAFTPKDQKAVKAASQAFRPNPAFSTQEAIGNLGVGEALVSFLDEKGSPQIVERAWVVPPESRIGPVDEDERKQLLEKSGMAGKYDEPIDRESAYEILTARAEAMNEALKKEEKQKAFEKAQKEAEKALKQREREERSLERQKASEERRKAMENKRLAKEQAANDPFGNLFGAVINQVGRTATNSIARQVGKAAFGNGIAGKIGAQIVRGILGGLMGGKR